MLTTPSSIQQTPDPLLSLPDVLILIGVAESTWFAGVASGRFPPPVKCGRRSFWPQSVIAAYIENLKQSQEAFSND
jgi:predicted DNA-binding transcriptional regulator AlpA